MTTAPIGSTAQRASFDFAGFGDGGRVERTGDLSEQWMTCPQSIHREGRPDRTSRATARQPAEGRDDLRLRVAVQPGGCSGLIYQLYFDERLLDGDVTRDFDGVEVVVDKMSVPYLDGASIDFEDTIQKQGFTIDNPNASGSCACGDSFH